MYICYLGTWIYTYLSLTLTVWLYSCIIIYRLVDLFTCDRTTVPVHPLPDDSGACRNHSASVWLTPLGNSTKLETCESFKIFIALLYIGHSYYNFVQTFSILMQFIYIYMYINLCNTKYSWYTCIFLHTNTHTRYFPSLEQSKLTISKGFWMDVIVILVRVPIACPCRCL